jgi:sugar/nucleoside kinase (ribokinase family)
MALLVVGSIALDSVVTPFGETADALGGAAVFFSLAGVVLHPVQVVGVVGSDFPEGHLATLVQRGVDLSGVERRPGESFRWKARYSYDLASRETLETRLGVFAEFRPQIPPQFRDARYVFLGNIDPELQLSVLDQVRQPELVVCDTMNYWIHSKRDVLLELLRHIDLLMVNDSEARELSGDWNIYRAAHWILGRGPKMAVIKQGEHGALLVDAQTTFKAPAYPLQEVFDPTGAGDAFAGGFMGYLARTGDLSFDNLRRAMVYGSSLGSFAVEAFGVQRLERATLDEVRGRVRAFHDLVRFELDGQGPPPAPPLP